MNKIFNLDWTFEEAYKIFGIRSGDKNGKIKNLGYELSEEQVAQMLKDENLLLDQIQITNGIVDILKDKNLIKCIGTGGPTIKTAKKIDVLKSENISLMKLFSRQKWSKEENQIQTFFFIQQKKMGFEPKDCLVIEDSIAGCIAAKAANMDVVAFTEHQHINREEYLAKLKEIGVTKFANNVEELREFIYK